MRATQSSRGYFGIGVEGVSKPMNLGALLRTAHAFGASFAFTIAPELKMREVKHADTSHAPHHLPFYTFGSVAELMLPKGCLLVGVELVEDATELPSFRHPQRAAYALGPERGSLSEELTRACDFLVRIPARFCVNLSVAGAIVMYDRVLSLGRFAERPLLPGGVPAPLLEHRHGAPIWVKKRTRRASGA